MSAHPEPSAEEILEAEQRAREKDPHGTAVADDGAGHAPKGYPTDHRHETESATKS